MRGVIVGGATFLGYWIKKRILDSGLSQPIIVDLPRTNIGVYVSSRDIFYRLQEIDYHAIEEYRPSYILFNYFDLFDMNSLEISQADNNVLMAATNKLLDIAQKQNCCIYVLTHIDRYTTSNDPYRTTFNSLNGLYLQYIELVSKARSLRTKIILLPNVFGPRESKQGVIPTIVGKVRNGEKLILADTTRDFLFVESVIAQAFDTLFDSGSQKYNQAVYYAYTSGKQTPLSKMYETVTRVLGKSTEIRFVEEPYKLIRAEIESSKIANVILEQDYAKLIKHYVDHPVI